MILMNLKGDRSEKVQYDYTDYPIYIRRGLISAYPNYAAPVHWHDDIELTVILSGEMQYNINGKVITLKENEGVAVNARQLHFGFSSRQCECDFFCVLLHPLMLCTSAAFERDFVLPVLRNKNAAFVKLSNKTMWQKEIIESVKSMYSLKGEKNAPLKIQTAFFNIWERLFENVALETRFETQSADLTVLKNMIGFIQQNYAFKISLADIAASGAVGQSKCCKLFAKYIRQSPNAYLTNYRLDKSTALLKNSDMTVTAIAQAVGFGGGSYYAEAFRKWSKKSPSEYRKTASF